MADVNTRKLDAPATLACIGALLCWSIGPIFIKLLTGYVDFWTQNILRYLVACLFWLPVLLVFAKDGRIDRAVWRKALLPAAANVFMQCFWAGAFYHINPALMNLLAKSSIIWITIFSLVFFAEERPLIRSARFWLGMTLCITGVVGVLVFTGNFVAPQATAGYALTRQTITGVALALVSALGWGIYTVSAKAVFKDIDSRIGFSVVTIYTVAGLGALAVLFGRPAECLAMGLKAWVYVVASGLTAIAFSHVLYYAAMKRIGATIPSLVLLPVPFVVLAISYVVFAETLSVSQWLFGIVLLTGSALAIWAQQHLSKIF